MKIRDERINIKVPNVGDCWKHKGEDAYFIRVLDSIGAKHYGEEHSPYSKHFYSVDLKYGSLVHTLKTESSIEVLDCEVVIK